MHSLRFVFLALLGSFVLADSFKMSWMYRSLVGSKDSDSADSGTYSQADEDDSGFEHVNCSGVTSTLGRAVKWFLAPSGKPIDEPHVRFFLSSRKQPGRVEVHEGKDFRLDATDFRSERRTVFITHGFKSSGFKGWVVRMENAFLSWGDVNVVVVDWSEGLKGDNYFYAAVNTKAVGNAIARFIHELANATKAAEWPRQPSWGALHLIGHSLGAQIMGIAAQAAREIESDWQVRRITGLDPAGPCFHDAPLDFRLDSTDADYVDVIHTSATTKNTFGFGMPDPIGFADFYVNGGNVQPGCSRRNGRLWKYVKKTSFEIGKCSHQRSYNFFTESIVSAKEGNCTFWATPWDPKEPDASRASWEECNAEVCSEMGIRAELHRQRGTFYVTTSASPPYCIPALHRN